MAPTLKNVIGRKIAATSFTKYSDSLKSVEGVWTEDKLMMFLTNPQQFAPGTSMPPTSLSKKEVREIVDVLADYSQ